MSGLATTEPKRDKMKDAPLFGKLNGLLCHILFLDQPSRGFCGVLMLILDYESFVPHSFVFFSYVVLGFRWFWRRGELPLDVCNLACDALDIILALFFVFLDLVKSILRFVSQFFLRGRQLA